MVLVSSSRRRRRPPRWLRRLVCRVTDHQVDDRHLANGCVHLCARCSWGVGVVPGPGVPWRGLRPQSADESQRAAVDYLLGVLGGDRPAREAAQERLLQDPQAAVATLATLVLLLSPDPGTREALQHLAAMGELRATVGEGLPS